MTTSDDAAPGGPPLPPADWGSPTSRPEAPGSWVAPPPPPPRYPRSARRRATVLVRLLYANVGVSVVAAAITVWGYVLLPTVEASPTGLEDATRFDAIFAGWGLVELVVFLATIVAWLAWQSRTVENAPRFGFGQPIWSPRASIVWWFVPFANIVMPYRIVNDLYKRMRSSADGAGSIVIGWWILYLVSGIVSNGAGRYWLADTTDTIPELQTGLMLYLASEALTVFAARAGAIVVTRIQAWADAREASLPASGSGVMVSAAPT